jgi:hypothetical protein
MPMFNVVFGITGRAVLQLVEELCHKAGGNGFDAV